MAQLPRRRAQHLASFAFAAVLAVATTAPADGDAPAVDLIGTWHVLIHFTDDHTHDPTLMRWDDKIWVFEEAGSRLRWTEYPIVVFADQSGRFENLGGSRAARVVHGWEPNESQRAQIARGLEVNPRGSTSKTLRRGEDGAWRSANRPASASARVVSYIQNWSIENPTTLPVFRREDTLGSATTEGYDGVTLFATEEFDPKAQQLRGSFERDGSRHGTFRMVRSGAASDVVERRRSEGQRFLDMFLRDGFAEDLERIAASEAVRSGDDVAVRSTVRDALERAIRGRDLDPAIYEPEIAGLARGIARALVDEKRSAAEVLEQIGTGKLNP